ncbi:cell envelope biogenesis protein TolA [Serratia fonticola]|uniref:cell envelope biogenesis protein TolA n=1 Tax=Serratia fonticola TaxID=47917 RepID=UPI0015C6885F|nr:cell envelope biogenesis protein TolA [Serratia fonticola]NYA42930.1 cell envelope biogenesis protein TolA [Serratia fonticola]
MSEATGLSIVIEPVNALAVFTQPDYIEQILQQVEEEVSTFVFDASTKKGRDAMASLGLKVAKTKTYLDGLGKDLVTEYKEVPKKIDASRKVVRDRLDALKEKVLQPKLEWEAEQDRIKAEEEARIAAEKLAAEIEELHEKALLMNEIIDRDAADAKAEAERKRIAHEEELKRQAAEQARIEAEQKAKAEIEAAARREAEANAAKARVELEAKQAAEQSELQRIEALQRAEAEKQQAIEAEQRRAKEETDRIKREAEQKEAARLAEEKRIADEADKRAKDVAHRKTVNNQALADLVAAGVPEDCAKKCITAIAKGEVSAIRITY